MDVCGAYRMSSVSSFLEHHLARRDHHVLADPEIAPRNLARAAAVMQQVIDEVPGACGQPGHRSRAPA
jgi:hypothetical protein